MTNHQRLGDYLASANNPAQALCVGIDPHGDTLNSWGVGDDPAGAKRFGKEIIDGCVETGIRIIKPQVALFERMGIRGLSVLSELIQYARQAGLWVIADAKRGDIGTTMEGYASAWLDVGGDFESDALTLNAFLGVEALEPAFHTAQTRGKTVFVLAATSNPEAIGLQSSTNTLGDSVAHMILQQLQARHERSGESGNWLGAVVGATVSLPNLGVDLEACPNIVLLAPGFGHQGAHLESLRSIYGSAYRRVIPTVSRSVAGIQAEGLADRIRTHRQELTRASV